MRQAIFGLVRPDPPPTDFDGRLLTQAVGASNLADVDLKSYPGALLSLLRSPSRGAEAKPNQYQVHFSVAVGRLDNAAGLAGRLGERRSDDASLIRAAYLRWGIDAVSLLRGDWAFAAWQPTRKRLVVARDACLDRFLCYAANRSAIVFGPSIDIPVAFEMARDLDIDYLARTLVLDRGIEGMSLYRNIRVLEPGELLTWRPGVGATVRRYWHPPSAKLQEPQPREWYAARASSLLDKAIRARLSGNEKVALALSGGLDSGALVTSVARCVTTETAVTCFTRVPAFETVGVDPADLMTDELHWANLSASAAGFGTTAVDARSTSPIVAIRWLASAMRDPSLPSNHPVSQLAIPEAVREARCGTLLTGNAGNLTLSYRGPSGLLPFRSQLRLGPRTVMRNLVGPRLARRLRSMRARRRLSPHWYREFAIHPQLVEPHDLAARQIEAAATFDKHTLRRVLLERSNRFECVMSRFGLSIASPYCDSEIIEFALSVPDEVFIDPATGTDRWLLREVARGSLPDEVRLNTRRGIQTADLVPRLRAVQNEVDEVLDELSGSSAADYVDVAHMVRTWRDMRNENTIRTFRAAGRVLCRGIHAGLCVNEVLRGAKPAGSH